jgi:acyl CoA:acetate/3-ketoacid CoA transferase
MRIIEPAAAAALVKSGSTVAISGGGYRAVPESMLKAIAARYRAEGEPKELKVVCVAMLERTRGGVGGEGTGLNRLAIPGLMKTLISSSFSRAPEREVNRLITSGAVAAYNPPMGTVLQWLRAVAAGRRGLATEVGIGTYVDPRVEGGRVNAAAVEPMNRLIEVDGEEMLFYPRFEVDVGIVKASASDERGNLYVDREVYDHGSVDVAMAARGSRGIVIAEVNRIVRRGEMPARMVRIPGGMVNYLVVADEAPWEDEQAPVLIGAKPVDLPLPSTELRPRDIIATLAVEQLPDGAMVNVGAGIPMYDVPEAARRLGRTDLYFTVEQGPAGGWPQVGGVSRNPEAVLGQSEVFDFYEGGGPDYSILSFGEMDAEGNVNVSRFGRMLTGSGGFINIVHGVRNLIFCGTLTTGGLDLRFGDGVLEIVKEGRVRRFVPKVEQITFNARRALARGHKVSVVTERALFAVDRDGWRLVAVAPGISVETDVLALIPFPVATPTTVPLLPAALFRAPQPVA